MFWYLPLKIFFQFIPFLDEDCDLKVSVEMSESVMKIF